MSLNAASLITSHQRLKVDGLALNQSNGCFCLSQSCFLSVANMSCSLETLFSNWSITRVPFSSKNADTDLVNSASLSFLDFPSAKETRSVYWSSNLRKGHVRGCGPRTSRCVCVCVLLSHRLRDEDSCQLWSGSIPAGSFCSATRKMFFSL